MRLVRRFCPQDGFDQLLLIPSRCNTFLSRSNCFFFSRTLPTCFRLTFDLEHLVSSCDILCFELRPGVQHWYLGLHNLNFRCFLNHIAVLRPKNCNNFRMSSTRRNRLTQVDLWISVFPRLRWSPRRWSKVNHPIMTTMTFLEVTRQIESGEKRCTQPTQLTKKNL